jgi:3,4-dihydroxy 2-butanone 4-phosphate synthase/GTP cyclohydrolase II
MAGVLPASVICEIMKDDGTMARLPDLLVFAEQHGLKVGTIAELIRYRSRTESLVKVVAQRPMITPAGTFDSRVYRDAFGGVHLALTLGQWTHTDDVLVRVHEPLSVLDWLDGSAAGAHSWPLQQALATLQAQGRGVALMLNCGETGDDLAERLIRPDAEPAARHGNAELNLRTYGVGAQILRSLGVARMRVLGAPRRMPSMTGYGLETVGFVRPGEAI